MPSNYKDSKIIIKRLRALHAEKKTNAVANRLLFSQPVQEKSFIFTTKINGRPGI